MSRETLESLRAAIKERDFIIDEQTKEITRLTEQIKRSEDQIREELKTTFDKDLEDQKQRYAVLQGMYDQLQDRLQRQSQEYQKMIQEQDQEIKNLEEGNKRSNNELYDHTGQRGRPKISQSAKHQIIMLRNQGKPIKSIAIEVGLSYGAVQKILKNK